MTQTQIDRLYRQAYERMERRFNGGGCYGMDWPTLRVVFPGWANTLKTILGMTPQ